jgi:Secretion system C-terminal sorting domain
MIYSILNKKKNMKKTFTLALLLAAFAAQAQFTANNLAVLRITSGSAIGNTGLGYATSIVEFKTDGTQTATTVNLSGGTPNFVVEERSVAHEGQLNLSGDRNYLTAVGYNSAVGTGQATMRTGEKRVARVDASGTVDLSTSIPSAQAFSGVSMRSALSPDGTTYYVQSGTVNASAHGVRTIPHGSSTSSAWTPGTGSGYRSINLFGGTVYSTQGASPVINSHDGTGTATAMTIAAYAALPAVSPEYTQMVFLDSNNDGAYDLLYVADRNSGLRKFHGSGTSWTPVGNNALGYSNGAGGGYLALTGRMEGGKPVLYAVKIIASTSSYIFKVVDNSLQTEDWTAPAVPGRNATITLLASTGANEQYKGIAFTPGSSLNVIPVELTTFKGSLINEKAALQWETATERNAKAFIVEKSTDAKSFAPIGTVAAKGGNALTNYNFDDTKLNEDINYYRLKMVDNDGSFKYSNTVAIKLGSKGSSKGLSLFPNPVKDHLTIDHAAADEGAIIRIVSITGSTVAQYTIAKDATQTSVDASQLAAGQYFINFVSKGTSVTTSFVK